MKVLILVRGSLLRALASSNDSSYTYSPPRGPTVNDTSSSPFRFCSQISPKLWNLRLLDCNPHRSAIDDTALTTRTRPETEWSVGINRRNAMSLPRDIKLGLGRSGAAPLRHQMYGVNLLTSLHNPARRPWQWHQSTALEWLTTLPFFWVDI